MDQAVIPNQAGPADPHSSTEYYQEHIDQTWLYQVQHLENLDDRLVVHGCQSVMIGVIETIRIQDRNTCDAVMKLEVFKSRVQ